MTNTPNSRDSLVDSLIARGIGRIEAGHPQDALELVIEAKSHRHPRPGIDMLRGIAFLRLGRASEAREALREELRFHPENGEAKAVLDSLGPDPALAIRGLGDPEFREILTLVRPYSMLSEERLLSLFTAARSICVDDIPGNFVECGVAAGGSSALLTWVVKRHSRRPRLVFSLDTFEGMPPPTAEDHHEGLAADATGWGTATCAAPVESLLGICRKLGTLDGIRPIKGLFQDTLPVHRTEFGQIAFLHMDGDWYDSTMAILRSIYDQVVPDGFVQVDDYGHWAGCRQAFHEFEASRGLRHELTAIDSTGVWFRKERTPPVSVESPSPIAPRIDVENAANIADDLVLDLTQSAAGARFVAGTGTWIGPRCSIRVRDSIRIGEHSVVEPGVLLADFDPYSPDLRKPVAGQWRDAGGLEIGANCRIGTGSTLVGPLRLGDGAVVLPGSFVDGDVPARTKVGGVPARCLERFDLLDGKWHPLATDGTNPRAGAEAPGRLPFDAAAPGAETWMTGKEHDNAHD